MYKYFSELEKTNDFKTYLIRESFDREHDFFVINITFSDNLLKKFASLFPTINKIDELIVSLNENLIMKTPEYNLLLYEDWLRNGNFFQHRDEEYLGLHDILGKQIDLTSWDLQYILRNICCNINYLVNFYPNYKEFLLNAQKEIEMIINEIKMRSIIKIPPKSEGATVNWPNSWYITPNGYLYNTGLGHKQGNLVYAFYYVICDFLKQNKMVPNINHYRHISDILKRGYITYDEFQNYSNLIYKLPTIITPEVEHDRVRYKNILKMSEEEYKKMLTASESEWPQPERSYQKNLITLIVGHLAAETSLYSSFARMNKSSHKNEMIMQLKHLAMNDMRDILVRFSGFHKIESIVNNTITTSSLNGITEFSEYLKRGWNLHIIPGIVYDQKLDKLSLVNFNSYFVSKHLDNELAKYDGKGRILIKDNWIN